MLVVAIKVFKLDSSDHAEPLMVSSVTYCVELHIAVAIYC